MAQVKIDLEKVPGIEMRSLCKVLVESVKRFYENPENVKRFEEWKREQAEKEAAQAEQCQS